MVLKSLKSKHRDTTLMNEGKIRSFAVNDDDAGIRIDMFLAEHSGLSRSRIKGFINNDCIVLNGESITKPSYQVTPGDHIVLSIPSVTESAFLPEKLPLDIIYRDEHIIVVNKPAGMVVHPGRGNVTGTLAGGLLYHCTSLAGVGDPSKPGIVHRLDKDTSGLLVAALNADAHTVLSQMVHDREVKRVYYAFVWGHPAPESGSIDAPLGRNPKNRIQQAVVQNGRHSVTHYSTLARYEFLTKLEVILETGRTHQIRVHTAHIGHHVFGDPVYGGRENRLKGFSPEIRAKARFLLKSIERQALHAARLAFDHPITGKALAFEAPFPDDLAWLQEMLDNEG